MSLESNDPTPQGELSPDDLTAYLSTRLGFNNEKIQELVRDLNNPDAQSFKIEETELPEGGFLLDIGYVRPNIREQLFYGNPILLDTNNEHFPIPKIADGNVETSARHIKIVYALSNALLEEFGGDPKDPARTTKNDDKTLDAFGITKRVLARAQNVSRAIEVIKKLGIQFKKKTTLGTRTAGHPYESVHETLALLRLEAYNNKGVTIGTISRTDATMRIAVTMHALLKGLEATQEIIGSFPTPHTPPDRLG